MTEHKEKLLTYVVVGLLLFIFNLVYVMRHEMVIEMNGMQFRVVGMMKYTNPADGNVVWMPLYSRGTK